MVPGAKWWSGDCNPLAAANHAPMNRLLLLAAGWEDVIEKILEARGHASLTPAEREDLAQTDDAIPLDGDNVPS